MFISELVKIHGIGVWVSCNKKEFPPFQVIDHHGNSHYKIQYADGHTLIVDSSMNDYNQTSPPQS